MPQLKLTYFDFEGGRGETPRIALSIPHRNNPNFYLELRGRAHIEPDHDRSFINRIALATGQRHQAATIDGFAEDIFAPAGDFHQRRHHIGQ